MIFFFSIVFSLHFFFSFRQIEEVYKKAHAAIRSDPSHKKATRASPVTKKRWNLAKLTHAQRKEKINNRKAAFLAKLKAESEA